MTHEQKPVYPSIDAYYEWLRENEKKYLEKHDEGISVGAEWYVKNFNLPDELDNLPDNSVVCDVGCADGYGVLGLQIALSRLKFIGVTPFLHETSKSALLKCVSPKEVPVYEGKIEELSDVLVRNGLPKPSVIIARNVMWLVVLAETSSGDALKGFTSRALMGLHNSVDKGGKVLIYDDYFGGQDFYDVYMRGIREMDLGFEPTLLSNIGGRNRQYLRLDRF